MIFKLLDGLLGGIDSVIIGLPQLPINILRGDIVCMALEHLLSVTFSVGLNPFVVRHS